MAAPTFVQVNRQGTTTLASSAKSFTGQPSVGNLLIVRVLQDGTTGDVTLSSVGSEISDLAGTTSAMTSIGAFDVGSPAAAKQHLWIGRCNATPISAPYTIATSGDDMYDDCHEFSGVNAGTALADVIENVTAGTATNGAGTSNTIADTGVTTLGADRLALQFVAVNDDNLLDAFTGETGGDWTEAAAEHADATGTDGAIGLQIATIASAGTINGGTDGMAASDGWGVVGFALIPSGAAAPASLIYQPGIQAAIPRSLYVR